MRALRLQFWNPCSYGPVSSGSVCNRVLHRPRNSPIIIVPRRSLRVSHSSVATIFVRVPRGPGGGFAVRAPPVSARVREWPRSIAVRFEHCRSSPANIGDVDDGCWRRSSTRPVFLQSSKIGRSRADRGWP